jgi:ribosomal protein L7/L12
MGRASAADGLTGASVRLSDMGIFGASDNGDDGLRRRIEELERRVAALERAATGAGQPIPPHLVGKADETWASDQVRQLVMQGNTIAAIKQLQAETGLGLKEAKGIVDRI